MTKRLALLSLVFVFSVSAFAGNVRQVIASPPAGVPEVAECRGVLTPEILDRVNAATQDPATTFKKQHGRTAAMPASVKCSSRLWQALQPNLSRDTRGLKPAPHIKPEKKQRGMISKSPRALDNDKDKDNNGNANGRSKDHGKPTEIVIKKAGSSKADLRTLPQDKPEKEERLEREGPEPNPVMAEPALDPDSDQGAAFRPVTGLALTPHVNVQAPPTIMNFNGLDFQNWGNGHPPDTNGDVGPDYYIQSINTSLGIYRKSDGVRVAAFSFNTFMSQGHFGNLCDTNNFGDPVVLYDSFEDRWIVTDFAFQLSGGAVVNPPGAFQCIAVSMNGDPVTGGWNYYSINTAGGLGVCAPETGTRIQLSRLPYNRKSTGCEGSEYPRK